MSNNNHNNHNHNNLPSQLSLTVWVFTSFMLDVLAKAAEEPWQNRAQR